MQILGPDGRPIAVKKQELSREAINSTLVGWRGIWSSQSVAAGLTPEKLSQILKSAASFRHGTPWEYLTLAEEMEEGDLHYASVLGTRKRAVSGLEIVVEAATDESRDQEIADAIREQVARPEFCDMLNDSLDAIGKGYSAVELVWRSGPLWEPDFIWRDPRHFRFDPETGRKLQIVRDDSTLVADDMPACKFIVHHPQIKSGLPIRGGLARLAAFAYMCKRWSIKDWLSFADIYGVPLRLGVYDIGTAPSDVEKLMAAVTGIGNDAAAVISRNMEIQFPNPPIGAGGDRLFEGLANWWDRQVSKGVLGQTMTADDGASLSQAKVHNDVREDILRHDARQLANTLNRDFVVPFVSLNFGAQKVWPRIRLHVPEAEDLALLVTALEKLVPLGLKVEQSVVRDKLGLPDPAEGKEADLLQAPTPTVAPQPEPEPTNENAANRLIKIDGDELESHIQSRMTEILKGMDLKNRATNRRATAVQEEVDSLADNAMERAGGYPIDEDAIRQAIKEASNKNDLEARLLRVFVDTDSHDPAFRQTLALADFAAQMLGYVAAEEGRS